MSDRIRLPAVAGTFYPEEPEALRGTISDYLNQSTASDRKLPSRLKALIVPHAGYPYSGSVAGCGYALLRNYADTIKRVWLIGPSHQSFYQGIALANFDQWQTPIGSAVVDPVNKQLTKNLPKLFFIDNQVHQHEHSLEVQLPFLLSSLVDFNVIPMLTGEIDYRFSVEVMDQYLGENDLLLVSSDLSHYLNYDQAVEKDEVAIDHITKLQVNKLQITDACGLEGIKIAMGLAETNGWQAELIDYRNSGDTAGGKDRVVGYTSIGFFE